MTINKVFIEIFKNRIQAIVEEMASVVLRTGFTAFVKETGDFGTYLISPKGETFGSPLEVGYNLSLGLPVVDVINSINNWNEGDIVICNDPYSTGGLATHSPDVYLMTPIFVKDKIIAYCLCFIHSSDVGGKVPGSVSPTSYDIHQEGIRLQPIKLYEKGTLNKQILELFLLNCRIPSQNNGDLNALRSALYSGKKRMLELVQRYGLTEVEQGIEGLLSYSEERVRALIREIPDGKYEFWDYLDSDDSNYPIRIRCKIVVAADEIFLDFQGTDWQSNKSINIPTFNKQGHYMIVPALIRYFRTLDKEIPWNSGMVRMITNEIPSSTILNCEFPAAVGTRAATFIRVMDVITGAMSKAQPNNLPAAGAGQACIVMLSAVDPIRGKRNVGVIQPICGGSGGRPMKDGIDGMDFAVGHLRNVPVEVIESEMPVLFNKYGLRKDSAGAGLYRGGYGIEVSFSNLSVDTILTARNMERMDFQPWGRLGGRPGINGKVIKNEGQDNEELLNEIDELLLQPFDSITFLSQGGGGFGDPKKRSLEKVLRDVRNGLLSTEKALEEYGAMIEDNLINEAESNRLRNTHVSNLEEFSYGHYRNEYESVWNDELLTLINQTVSDVPTNLRRYMLNSLRKKIKSHINSNENITSEKIKFLFQEIESTMHLSI